MDPQSQGTTLPAQQAINYGTVPSSTLLPAGQAPTAPPPPNAPLGPAPAPPTTVAVTTTTGAVPAVQPALQPGTRTSVTNATTATTTTTTTTAAGPAQQQQEQQQQEALLQRQNALRQAAQLEITRKEKNVDDATKSYYMFLGIALCGGGTFGVVALLIFTLLVWDTSVAYSDASSFLVFLVILGLIGLILWITFACFCCSTNGKLKREEQDWSRMLIASQQTLYAGFGQGQVQQQQQAQPQSSHHQSPQGQVEMKLTHRAHAKVTQEYDFWLIVSLINWGLIMGSFVLLLSRFAIVGWRQSDSYPYDWEPVDDFVYYDYGGYGITTAGLLMVFCLYSMLMNFVFFIVSMVHTGCCAGEKVKRAKDEAEQSRNLFMTVPLIGGGGGVVNANDVNRRISIQGYDRVIAEEEMRRVQVLQQQQQQQLQIQQQQQQQQQIQQQQQQQIQQQTQPSPQGPGVTEVPVVILNQNQNAGMQCV